MPYTNFCCRSGGNDLNAGTVDGSDTEPGVNPLVIYTSGDWDGTSVYTAPVGADMTEAQVGRFASIYVDGISAAASSQWMHARITAVDSGTRQITVSTTARSLFGTIVTAGTGNRSMRIGGAWEGATSGSSHPFSTLSNACSNAANQTVKLHLKNNQIYARTTVGLGTVSVDLAGYSSSYMDGGFAEIKGPSSGASIILWNVGTLGGYHHDLCFNGNGSSSSQTAITTASNTPGTLIRRLVVKNMPCAGINITQQFYKFVECEFFNLLTANAANSGYISTTTTSIFENCIFSGSGSGTNRNGLFGNLNLGGGPVFNNCVFRNLSGTGIYLSGRCGCHIANCDFYNCGQSGIVYGAAGQTYQSSSLIKNNNFVKNARYGIEHLTSHTSAANNNTTLLLQNNGFGGGSDANSLGNHLLTDSKLNYIESGSVNYTSHPWQDPANGDFRIIDAAAKGTGRGAFLQTTGGSGSVGYPDIGSCQAISSGGMLLPRAMNGGYST